MLTKWAKRYLRVRDTDNYVVPGTGTSGGKACYEFKNSAGDTYYGGPVANSIVNSLLKSVTAHGASASRGIALGTGTTAPTEDDYTIESIISSGLAFSATPSKQQSYDTTNDVYSVFYDLAINNTSDSAITINEICYFQIIYNGDSLGGNVSSSTTNANSVLVDRTVLESPLVIPAGESRLLRYSFNY